MKSRLQVKVGDEWKTVDELMDVTGPTLRFSRGLSVIIPSRNADNLVECVGAVRRCDPGASIIVVDNGVDFSREQLHGADIRRTVYLPEIPFVFSRAVNQGIEMAGQDDVMILNDDALLESPGGFLSLQRAAEEHPEYGLIASTCNNVGNRNQWRREGGGISGAGARGGLLDGLRDEPRMVCFVAVLIPRRTIDTVGLLDERFVGYGMDDDDYSLRVRKAGLKIGIHDGCYVDHGSLTSSYRGEAGAGGNFLPNMKLFIEKWGVDNWGQPRESSQFAHLFPQAVPA